MISAQESTHKLTEAHWQMMSHFSLAAFKILSLSLTFDSLIIMCLGLGLFRFILVQVHWSWICMSIKALCPFLSLSSPSVTPTMHILFRLRVFQKSLRFSSLFFILFLFLPVLMESPLHYALDWVLQLLIWCSEFSQKYSSPYTVLKMVSPWGMRACFSLVHHLAEVIPNCLIFTPTFILLNEDYYIQLTLSNTGG